MSFFHYKQYNKKLFIWRSSKCLLKEAKLKKKRNGLVEWLNTAVECEIIIRDDATGIHKVKKQTAKLSITIPHQGMW